MFKYIWWLSLMTINSLVSALSVNSSGGAKVFRPIPQIISKSPVTHDQSLANINNIDTNADNLIQLRRKLEVEKAEVELRRLKNGTNVTASGNKNSISLENAQTTVTGVAINQDGRKIAWLQFADGGSLAVNLGSKIGKYKVTNIEMTGVTLTYTTGKTGQYIRNINLRRSYIGNYTSRSNFGSHLSTSFGFVPSPVLTSANSNNDVIPPIVPVR